MQFIHYINPDVPITSVSYCKNLKQKQTTSKTYINYHLAGDIWWKSIINVNYIKHRNQCATMHVQCIVCVMETNHSNVDGGNGGNAASAGNRRQKINIHYSISVNRYTSDTSNWLIIFYPANEILMPVFKLIIHCIKIILCISFWILMHSHFFSQTLIWFCFQESIQSTKIPIIKNIVKKTYSWTCSSTVYNWLLQKFNL